MHKMIKRREINAAVNFGEACHPLLARLYASRGITSLEETELRLEKLLPFHQLLNIDEAVAFLYDALVAQKRFLVVGDFDADGATSTALAVSALRALGAKQVDFLVPNRFTYGYGLTPGIVDEAAKRNPDVIITVDNGISSVDGVARANALGIQVVVTDHHLPGNELPDAAVIVNPNQHNCEFASKNIAGVGVIFYVLTALRASCREKGWFETQSVPEPNMGDFLDLVALGTVADVVALDQTNRILVAKGLQRMRQGKMRPGIAALLKVAGRQASQLVASDLGFAVGPRLNAAGRLEDMSLGINCLLSTNENDALKAAKVLDELNKERRAIEDDMKTQALASIKQLQERLSHSRLPYALTLYEQDWHQGVIGIVAGRIKEQFHRPVVAFAKVSDTEIKGSARSIPGCHIRDVLDRVATENPGLITKFGGHAMAAGLSIEASRVEDFRRAFDSTVKAMIDESLLAGELLSDGPLTQEEFTYDIAKLVREAGPWGQAFPEPVFDNIFMIRDQRLVGEKHLKLILSPEGSQKTIEAICFFVDLSEWPDNRTRKIHAAYQLDINEFRGNVKLQLLIRQMEKV